MGQFLTIADLRRITGEPAHVLNFAIDRHGPQPVGRIGIARVWTEAELPAIRESLRKTAARSTTRAKAAEAPDA